MKKTLSLGFLLVAVLLAVMVAAPVFGGNHGGDVEGAKKAQKGLNGKVLPNKDVVGTAIGQKDGVVVLRVFTAKSGVAGIPKKQDGFDVLVKVTGPIVAVPLLPHAGAHSSGAVAERLSAQATGRFSRPVPIGISTGNEGECSSGTIGARLTDGTNVYALSNNHVYSLENNAPLGSDVLQPGRYDTGCNVDPNDVIGTLDDFEPIVFSTSANNTIDAAIALSSTANLGNSTPSSGYGMPRSTIMSAALGQAVQKFGRTTELTKGTITGINATVNVGYSSGTARFVDQIIVEDKKPFIKGGDSGSLLVTDPDAYPTGLLYAGSMSGKFAVANRIDLVLSRYGVTVDGYSGSPPPPNDAPTATITSPEDSTTFESGATVLFEGTASDTEDGDLTADLAWASDIDGPIGTGGSFSTTLSDGNHTITASATDSGDKTGSDSISITGGSPPPTSSMSVTVTTDKASYVNRENVLMTVTVTDGADPVAGAAVHVQVTTAKGNTLGGDNTTNNDGVANFRYKVNSKRDGVGTYTVDATASKSGYDPASGSTTFEVTK